MGIVTLIEFHIINHAMFFLKIVDSVEDLAPEIIDKVVVPAVLALVVVVQAAVAVVEVAMAAAEDLVEVILIFFFYTLELAFFLPYSYFF